MYLDHWSLEYPPFEPIADSRFLFPTAQHEQALAAVSYAACDGGEPVLVCGAPGCGKTIVLRALRRQLPQAGYHVAFVPEITCSQIGLARRVAYHLTHNVAEDTETALNMIVGAVRESGKKGETIVLMLDDWPAEPTRYTLEELRWLLNLDLDGAGRVVVLLTGEYVQPAERWPTWLTQRLSATAVLGPLPPNQTVNYLAHRLRIASAAPVNERHEHTFEPAAAQRIAEWSGGVPRLINRAAHLALHVAYLDLAPHVSADAVHRALDRLSPNAEPQQRALFAESQTRQPAGAQP